MNMRICDVCGDEIKECLSIETTIKDTLSGRVFDACPKCIHKITKELHYIQEKLILDIYDIIEKTEHETNKVFITKFSTALAKKLGGEIEEPSDKKAKFQRYLSLFFDSTILSVLDKK